jgi:hypothetical protein
LIIWAACQISFSWAARHWLGDLDASMRRMVALLAVVISTLITMVI